MALEHIKIPAVTPIILYNVTVPVPALTIPFPFFEFTDIQVTWEGVVRTLGVDYNVVGTGGYDKGYPGGLITFFTPQANKFIQIKRVLPIRRIVDFPNSGPLQTAALNTELDKSVAIDQQLALEIGALDVRIDVLELGDPRLGRALLFPPEDLLLNHSLPSIGNRSNLVMGFRFDGEIQMFAAIVAPPNEPTNNFVLPGVTGRANKVIGFGISGEMTMNEVVAGSIVPNADNISYLAPYPTAVARSVAEKLNEHISIKDFGTDVGEGIQANDDAALAAALTYFNTNAPSGSSFATLWYPDGVYFHGPCPITLLRSRVCIRGESSAGAVISFQGGGTFLNIGSATGQLVEHFVFENLAIDCTGVAATLFNVQHVKGAAFRDLSFLAVDTILNLGTEGVANASADTITLHGCTGTTRNSPDKSLVQLNSGRVFEAHSLSFSNPGGSATAAAEVAVLEQRGVWTTVLMERCSFSGFDYGLIFIAPSGHGVDNVSVTAVNFEDFKSTCIYMLSQTGGFFRSIHVANCWIECRVSDGIFIQGPGINDNHSFTANNFVRAGRSNIFMDSPFASSVVIANNRFANCNAAGTANANVHIVSGGGVTITGNVNNLSPIVTQQAAYGLEIAGGCDKYLVSANAFQGLVGSIKINPDGLLSPNRRVFGNTRSLTSQNGYAGIVYAALDGSNQYHNVTPFVQEVYLLNGGGLLSVLINGVSGMGLAPVEGPYRLEPGEHIFCTSVDPQPQIAVRICE